MSKPLLPNYDSNLDLLLPFSRVRLVVVDLDGTLIPSDLEARVQSLVRKLQYHKVHFTIATGRTLSGALPNILKLDLSPKIPIILYNGSVIIWNNNYSLIDKKVIPNEALRHILSVSADYRVRTLAYTYYDPIYAKFQLMDNHEYVYGWSSIDTPQLEFNKMMVDWQDSYIPDDIEPSAILIDTTMDPSSSITIEANLAGVENISITRSSSSYIEVRPKGTDKGVALERVASMVDLTRDEIVALGDNDNDVEMLSWAGIGIAIGSASDRAIAHSDYICHYGSFSGVVEVLNLVLSAKRFFGSN